MTPLAENMDDKWGQVLQRMVDQYIDLCQTEGPAHSALKRTDIDAKQQTKLAELTKDIKEMKEQYEKNIAKIRVDNKENTRKEINNTLTSYTGYHCKSKYGKTFASKLEDILDPREVRELSSFTGRGASVFFGGNRIFWGSQRGIQFFSEGQRGPGGPEFFEGHRGGDQSFFSQDGYLNFSLFM